MSGYRSSALRHDCGQGGCLIQAMPSWDWMFDCFPRGIRPTDVDGMVELSGHLLLIEQKRTGVSLPEGQRKALVSFASRPAATVLVLRGDEGTFEALVLASGEGSGFHPCAQSHVRDWISAWVKHAEAYPYRMENAVDTHEKPCEHCHGVGRTPLANPVPGGFVAQLCIHCKGSGRPAPAPDAR